MNHSSWRSREIRRWVRRVGILSALVGLVVAAAAYTTLFWKAGEGPLTDLPFSPAVLVAVFSGIACALGLWLIASNQRQPSKEAGALGEAGLRVADLDLRPRVGLSRLRKTSEALRKAHAVSRSDAVAIFNELISSGFSVGASDIHVAPERDRVAITYRVDGVLHDVGSLPRKYAPLLANRVKILSRLPTHVHAVPQDGRIAFDRDDYHIRVSILPTNHGEKLVLRLAFAGPERYDLDRIDLPEGSLVLLKTLIGRDRGVIYLTGPTGSGKTTTLYASILHIQKTRKGTANIVTLEDPIEVDLKGISQTQVDPASGLTFAVGLRSLLRQDPDVLMVGEIRDNETAETAIRAALTGHLLLTTVHADSTIGVFNRLRQFDLDPFQVASASVAVVNQRLAIRNCPDCLHEVELTDFQRQQFQLLGVIPKEPVFVGGGCPSCRGTGRSGRVPIYEILPVTDTFRDHLLADMPAHKLIATAVDAGMATLADQSLELAAKGVIPVDEVIRLLSM